MSDLVATELVEFFVPGTPVPQGSKQGYVVKGRALIVDDNAKVLKPWRKLVTLTAKKAFGASPRIEGAVALTASFRFVKPRTVDREFMTVKPDADKLLRALLDGITDAGVWRDDAQVIRAYPEKVYATEAGVLVRIGEYRHHPTLEGATA